MKVKGKTELEAIAKATWDDYEYVRILKPCEIAYIIGELSKKLSLGMLRMENDREH